jgi:hypothetical protein
MYPCHEEESNDRNRDHGAVVRAVARCVAICFAIVVVYLTAAVCYAATVFAVAVYWRYVGDVLCVIGNLIVITRMMPQSDFPTARARRRRCSSG